jgi:Domain of unknown function (DUF1127)
MTLRALADLDERQLRDIGLTRDEALFGSAPGKLGRSSGEAYGGTGDAARVCADNLGAGGRHAVERLTPAKASGSPAHLITLVQRFLNGIFYSFRHPSPRKPTMSALPPIADKRGSGRKARQVSPAGMNYAFSVIFDRDAMNRPNFRPGDLPGGYRHA